MNRFKTWAVSLLLVALAPTAAQAALTITGNPNFGNQLVGTTSAPRTFTLTNTDPTDVNFTSIGETNFVNFIVSSDTCFDLVAGPILANGGTCTFDVSFSPNAASSFNGIISFNPPSTSINVTGQGINAAIPALNIWGLLLLSLMLGLMGAYKRAH